jgi:iron complex outermembrane receptor protein
MQYELGIKTTTDKMAIGLSTFYSTWNNLQVSLILNTFNNGCNSTVTTNAGKASSKGAEASFEYRPLGALSLSADVTYTKAVLGAPPPGVAVGTEGEPLQNAPIWQGTIGASYTFPVLADYVGTFRTDFSYYGWQWSNQASENNPFFFVHARSLLNFGLSVEPSHGRWSVELFAHNALNREQEYGAQSFFGEPLTNQVLVGAPLTLGLTAKWTFDNP